MSTPTPEQLAEFTAAVLLEWVEERSQRMKDVAAARKLQDSGDLIASIGYEIRGQAKAGISFLDYGRILDMMRRKAPNAVRRALLHGGRKKAANPKGWYSKTVWKGLPALIDQLRNGYKEAITDSLTQS